MCGGVRFILLAFRCPNAERFILPKHRLHLYYYVSCVILMERDQQMLFKHVGGLNNKSQYDFLLIIFPMQIQYVNGHMNHSPFLSFGMKNNAYNSFLVLIISQILHIVHITLIHVTCVNFVDHRIRFSTSRKPLNYFLISGR